MILDDVGDLMNKVSATIGSDGVCRVPSLYTDYGTSPSGKNRYHSLKGLTAAQCRSKIHTTIKIRKGLWGVVKYVTYTEAINGKCNTYLDYYEDAASEHAGSVSAAWYACGPKKELSGTLRAIANGVDVV